MPKIQRGCLGSSNSQYLSLSAENSIDRMRFRRDHGGANGPSGANLGDNRSNQDRNRIIQNENTVNDMYKSFSSADRIHFIEDQRRSQNLVGDFEEEDDDLDELDHSSRNANSHRGDHWNTENDDNYNIISIRDSNLETPAQS